MRLNKVIPKIFYSDINHGLELFIDVLGFTIKYKEDQPGFYIVARDGVTLFLVEDDEFAKKDRPEIRIDTDDIDALYQELIAKPKQLFHSNLATVKLQPWGLKEVALRDKSDVCVILQQDMGE
ncbi:hypothetical protein [Mucilaginibacter sp. UYCu711]|uniref:hypothetical protein n=1 Tax=Mucilaginibacter sp. UYCu711 TaxID=3156339 RepID=UPI003D1B54A5